MPTPSSAGSADAGPQPRRHNAIAARVLGEARSFLAITAYLWVVFALFVLQRSLVLAEHDLDGPAPYGFALVHALVFAKIILVGDWFGLGRGLEDRPLIQPILLKSGAFAALFVGVHVVERGLARLWHGEEATSGTGTVEGLLVVGIICFIELIPFFAVRELGRVMGRDRLRQLLLERPARIRPPTS
jgi:hypothetical protein